MLHGGRLRTDQRLKYTSATRYVPATGNGLWHASQACQAMYGGGSGTDGVELPPVQNH